MTEIVDQTRRKLCGLLGTAAISLLVPPRLLSHPPSVHAETSPAAPTDSTVSLAPKTIFDTSGLHDAPRLKGSVNLALMEEHMKAMGIKFVVGHLPSPEWYQSVKRIGATPIVRLYPPNNRFNSRILRTQLSTVPIGTLVVPANEPNLSGEDGWRPILPEQAAENDYKSFKLIADHGCIPMVTPTSPGGNLEYKDGQPVLDETGMGYDEEKYFFLFMNRHAELGTFMEYPQAVMAMHAYDFRYYNPSLPSMWDRLKDYNDKFIKPVAGNISIYVTEGGFFLADVEDANINQEAIGADIENFLNQNLIDVVGPDLTKQIKAYCWWIYANNAQLLPTDHTSDRFEKNAVYEKLYGQQSRTNAMYDGFVRAYQRHR